MYGGGSLFSESKIHGCEFDTASVHIHVHYAV